MSALEVWLVVAFAVATVVATLGWLVAWTAVGENIKVSRALQTALDALQHYRRRKEAP